MCSFSLFSLLLQTGRAELQQQQLYLTQHNYLMKSMRETSEQAEKAMIMVHDKMDLTVKMTIIVNLQSEVFFLMNTNCSPVTVNIDLLLFEDLHQPVCSVLWMVTV